MYPMIQSFNDPGFFPDIPVIQIGYNKTQSFNDQGFFPNCHTNWL